MKKALSFVLALMVAFSCLALCANASDDITFIYSVNNDAGSEFYGMAQVQGFVDNGAREIAIPGTINRKTVCLCNLVSVPEAVYNGNPEDLDNLKKAADNTSVISVTFPRELVSDFKAVNIFKGLTALERIEANIDNEDYSSSGGVLFYDDVLVCYPAAKPGSIYSVPFEITALSDESFSGNKNIETVEILSPCRIAPKSVSPFAGCSKIKEFKTSGTAAGGYFTSDGILYNGNKLVQCPPKSTLKSVSVPSGVNFACKGSMINIFIESITINSNLAFSEDPYLPALVSVKYGPFTGNYSSCAKNASAFICRCAAANLSSISADEGNRVFSVINNVLYNYAQTELVAYPPGLSQSCFILPETVKSVYGRKIIYFNLNGTYASALKKDTILHMSPEQFDSIMVSPSATTMFSVFSKVCSNTTRKKADIAADAKKKEMNGRISAFSYISASFGTDSIAGLNEKAKTKTLSAADTETVKTLNSYAAEYGFTAISECITYTNYLYSYSVEVCDNNHVTAQDYVKDTTQSGKVIKANPSGKVKAYDYGSTVTFYANVPKGGKVYWYVDDNFAGEGETYKAENIKESFTLKAIAVSKNGNKVLDKEKIEVDSTFWAKFVWFFRHLFSPKSYIIEQK
ncbi:MAG: hypothetical protein IKR90_05010 [Clostridia bacterium]|nr:hypothetical protein [Clostridia bacterium]